MSTFHENIRAVLAEVDKFIEGLKSDKLSKKNQSCRDKLIEVIKKLRQDWPALENPANQSDLKVPDNDPDHVSDGSIKTKTSQGSGNAEEEDVVYSENVPEKSVKELTELTVPTKKGFLEKRRKKPTLLGATYQKRFCVISNGFFYYYEKNTDKKQAGAFSLEGYEFKEAPQYVQGKDVNKKFCFELTATGKRPFQFLVESKEEFQSWQAAITGSDSSGTGGDIPVEGEFEDIYEEMDEVAERAKALAENDKPEGKIEEEEVYDDADTAVVGEMEEIYDDVDNTAPLNPPAPLPDTDDLPPPPPGPPPVPPPIQKKLPDLPLPDLPLPDPPLPDPPTIQDQPLPDLPPPRPEKVPPRQQLVITENPDEDYENMYYGKWDCTADGENELSFKRCDIIHIINRELDSKDWWVGRLNEKYGLVPKTFLVKAYKAV